MYTRGKYRDIILPFTVLRRLDALLEDTKDTVLETNDKLEELKIDNRGPQYCIKKGEIFLHIEKIKKEIPFFFTYFNDV